MSKSRFLNRKPKLQALDRRCVMDAEGIELPVEIVVVDDGEMATSEEIRTLITDEMIAEDIDVTTDEVSIEDADVIFQTLGGNIDVEPARNMDVNGNGTVTPQDALLIINAISRQQRGAGAEGASRAALAASMENGDSLDVNQDTRVTPFDALLVINSLARQRAAEANALMTKPLMIPEDGVLPEESVELVKSLGLADVGNYGGVSLELDSEGLIKAEADGETLAVTVGEDGFLSIGDERLPISILKLEDCITVSCPTAVDEVVAAFV